MVTKNRLLKHLKNDIYCRIGVSKVHGVGVIAIKDIPKGTIPFATLSKEKEEIITLTKDEIKDIHPNVRAILQDFFGDKKSNVYDVYAYGPNYINISFYLNHSDKPNIDVIEDTENNYFRFVTNRIIKKGEELFINYNKYSKDNEE
jgi:SET domain-containing protein